MSVARTIIIGKEDHERLERLFMSRFATAFGDKPYLKLLRRKLDRALVVASDEIPPDVVSMNATVRLQELGRDEIDRYTLVYPQEANIAEGKLSVLAPLGTAILGQRVGDTVRWQVPSGWTRFRIQELVHQPACDSVIV